MGEWIGSFLDDRSGATAIEYGMIAGFISIAIIAGATTLGTKLAGIFNAVGAGFGN
jgi:pilus assembly protein Flp/PilA